MAENKAGYTGYRRSHTTRWSVKLADRSAGRIIAIGGVGTIISVSLVFVVLLWKVLPLFESPEVIDHAPVALGPTPDRPVLAVDEYRTVGWLFDPTGTLRTFRLDNGKPLSRQNLTGGKNLTAWSFSLDRSHVVLAFADGSIRTGRIEFTDELVPDERIPEDLRNLEEGSGRETFENQVVMRTPSGLRLHGVGVTMDDPVEVCPGEPIVRIDRAQRASGPILAMMTDAGKVFVRDVRKQENLMTGEIKTILTGGDFQIDVAGPEDLPRWLKMAGAGDSVYLVWPNGQLARYDIRDLQAPRLVERVDLVDTEGRQVAQISFLLGRGTLLVGDSAGNLTAWFRRRPTDPEKQAIQAARAQEARQQAGSEQGPGSDDAPRATDQLRMYAGFPIDEWKLVAAHSFEGTGSAVTSISSSQRTRVATIGFASGHVQLLQITAENKLVDLTAEANKPVATAVLAPKQDAVYALTAGKLHHWSVDLKYPEASFKALFLPVWYEGAPQPEHVWQSSSAEDSFEPKLGMVPLIFGTLKATFYSLLFGVPLAMLAAVYSSEFLNPKLKSRIKPTVEMMASLPSVVLGFLAALVLAPLVAKVVPELLTAIYLVPLALLTGAYLWQLVPGRIARLASAARLPLMLGFIFLGIVVAWWMGPVMEDWLFAGNIKQWLTGGVGTGTGGWLLLLIPLTAVGVLLGMTFVVNPALRSRTAGLGSEAAALLDLVRFVLSVGLTLAVAWGVSFVLARGTSWIPGTEGGSLGWLHWSGWDPRGGSSFLGTYDQRNALIVGFIMGFAIIPIIYTIAEDALSTVPDHLRAASLGAGATPWQTATRIVIPTAMSGLFSAVMIGLGRAVGETMIVLMAAGNIPVMEWNIFNGMRTLAANIAVEMPEAAEGSAHWRTLFLAALVLFAMTFVVNTAAELVRLRFRKKAYQL